MRGVKMHCSCGQMDVNDGPASILPGRDCGDVLMAEEDGRRGWNNT